MAEKKTIKKNVKNEKINDVEPKETTIIENEETTIRNVIQEEINEKTEILITETEQQGSIFEEVQKGVEQKVNQIANEFTSKIEQVKKQEESFMKKIDANQNDALEIAQEELKKVNKQIKEVEEQIKSKTNNIGYTYSWNGWGYDY